MVGRASLVIRWWLTRIISVRILRITGRVSLARGILKSNLFSCQVLSSIRTGSSCFSWCSGGRSGRPPRGRQRREGRCLVPGRQPSTPAGGRGSGRMGLCPYPRAWNHNMRGAAHHRQDGPGRGCIPRPRSSCWSGAAPGSRLPAGMRVASWYLRFVGSACAKACFRPLQIAA